MAKSKKQASQQVLFMKKQVTVEGKKVASTATTYELDGVVYPKVNTVAAIGKSLIQEVWLPVGYIDKIEDRKGVLCMIVNGEPIVIRDQSSFIVAEMSSDEEEEEVTDKKAKKSKKSKKSKKAKEEEEDDDDDDDDDSDSDDDDDDDDDALDLDDDSDDDDSDDDDDDDDDSDSDDDDDDDDDDDGEDEEDDLD